MARSRSTFRVGHRKFGGRRKGTPNKKTVIQTELRIIESLDGGLLRVLELLGPARWFAGLSRAHQVTLVIAAMQTQNLRISTESAQLAALLCHHLELNESVVEAIKNQNSEHDGE